MSYKHVAVPPRLAYLIMGMMIGILIGIAITMLEHRSCPLKPISRIDDAFETLMRFDKARIIEHRYTCQDI